MKTLGERLKYLREKHLRISQKEFGSGVGISQATIGNYEAGASKPDFEAIHKIVKAHGVNYEWLAEGTGEMLKSDNNNQSISIEENPIYRALIESNNTLQRTVNYFLTQAGVPAVKLSVFGVADSNQKYFMGTNPGTRFRQVA